MYKVTTHGSPKSQYDRKIRSFASQYREAESSIETVRQNLVRDIASIKRANTSVASAAYTAKIIDQFEPSERLEIWNDVIPGKARLIVTIQKEVSHD